MITLDDKGITISEHRPDIAWPRKSLWGSQYQGAVVVYYIFYKDIYKRILSWEANMKKEFLEFLDDIITTVIDNCEVEVTEWVGDDGRMMGEENIVRQNGIDEKLLAVIKKHLDKVED